MKKIDDVLPTVGSVQIDIEEYRGLIQAAAVAETELARYCNQYWTLKDQYRALEAKIEGLEAELRG